MDIQNWMWYTMLYSTYSSAVSGCGGKGADTMAGFESVLGNEQVREYFRHAVDSGKVSHCYVLSGEDGLGKMTLAKAFAQTLLCDSPVGRPCGKCHSCVQFESGNHPDVIYTTHEKPTVIGVDDVRTGIVEDIALRPYSSDYKIYIMDEAEKLSVQAQNALLKTIEEPPSYGILMLLTTNAAGLLDTIRSRSILLSMLPLENQVLESYLRKEDGDAQKIPSLVKFAQGNIGKAMKLSGSENFSAMMDQIMELLKKADILDFETMLTGIENLETFKINIKDCLSFIRMWFRDVLLYKATGDPNLLIFFDEIVAIRRYSTRFSYNGINRILDEIEATERRLDANVNFSLSMELLWLTIRDGSRD